MLSVVLPTFNEAPTIASVVEDLLEVTAARNVDVELLVVDDHSPDGTAALIAARFAQEPRVRLHVRDERGLAGAVRRGVEMARGDLVVFMDTDGNHDPAFVPALVEAAATADIAVGSRFLPGGGMPTSRFREICSRPFNRWACRTLALPVTDCLSGFLCVRRRALAGADFDAVFVGYGGYAIHLLYWAARQGLRIAEVPVVYGPRLGGVSKTRFFAILRDYYCTVRRLRRHGLRAERHR
jgi:dolichol-phosphate mannosyltransferase